LLERDDWNSQRNPFQEIMPKQERSIIWAKDSRPMTRVAQAQRSNLRPRKQDLRSVSERHLLFVCEWGKDLRSVSSAARLSGYRRDGDKKKEYRWTYNISKEQTSRCSGDRCATR
jgi:hypothetical protein